MAQTVFIPREIEGGESRVAASADTVKRMIGLGFDVIVESGAGVNSRIVDADFQSAGAVIGKASDSGKADVVLKVRRPTAAEFKGYQPGAAVLAIMDPYGNRAPGPLELADHAGHGVGDERVAVVGVVAVHGRDQADPGRLAEVFGAGPGCPGSARPAGRPGRGRRR